MRIVDAVTFEVVMRTEPKRMLLITKHETNEHVAYHAACMAYKNENIGKTVAGTTHAFTVQTMDDVGPQPPCRYCEADQY